MTTGERFLFGCLLVAIIIGTFDFIFWRLSIEQRLADNLQIHWHIVGDDKSRTNMLAIHERRLRVVEHISWAAWDHHALGDGWRTQPRTD